MHALHHSRRQSGFTLLETLMAIVLLALLIAGAYSGLNTSVRAMHAGERLIDRVDRIRTVQEFLRHQLSRMLPLAFAQTDTARYVFEGDTGFMRFVAPMPGYLSRGGPYVQTLELAHGNEGLQLVFTTTMLNGFDLDKVSSADVQTVVLLDHIRQGRFEYRALDEQGQLMQWSSSWDDSSSTPLMVQIELTLNSGTQINWPTLAVPMMLDAGALRARGGAVLPRMPR